ncbi:uncharacterized protein LTHEOB_5199 [Lasiodiplodia theobromae]|uniref:uncharacterized protein n=1 Tax=Lasiodiplodia theobromae TaxID=45133 RepID=UPI0015C3FA88|nr:uncharacterized protein LTHEOB_5199 [Lasiodiplodia theobromae]KAF4545366.1 hypothetical protein LTHEOB_5199 [Lasiodiplodia theobromae]
MKKTRRIFGLKKHATNEFVEERLPNVDSTLQSLPPAHFSDAVGQYLSDDLPVVDDLEGTDRMRTEARLFQDAFKDFEHGLGYETEFSKQKVMTWDDVLRIAESEAEAYKQKGDGEGLKANIRGLFRKFHKFRVPVETCIKLLPSISWETSLVCGGLTVILQAASKLGKMREDTYTAMEEVPRAIARSSDLIAIYALSKRRKMLEEHVSQLFVSILKFLRNTLGWYAQNAAQKFVGALFRLDDYGKTVTASIDDFKDLINAVNEEAKMNEHQTIADIRQEVQGFKEWGMQVKNDIFKHLRVFEIEQQNCILLDHLVYSHDQTNQDLHDSLAIGHTFALDVQDRTAWILQSPELTDWLCSPRLSLLEINAGEDRHETGNSSASFFSALLIRALLASGQSTVLYWFCGQHILEGWSEMTQALIGQLIENGNERIQIPASPQIRALDDLDEPERLLKLLRKCVKQELQHSPVCVIIDSVSFYEDRRRRYWTHKVIEELESLDRYLEKEKSSLKILLTSPVRSDFSSGHRESSVEVLDVPDVIDGCLQGLNEESLMNDIEEHTSNMYY